MAMRPAGPVRVTAPEQVSPGVVRGGSFAIDDLTVDFLKRTYLLGIQINGVDDEFFLHHLENAMEWVRDHTSTAIRDEFVEDEPHDYFAADWMQYSFLKVNRGPVKLVQKISAVYPTGNYLFEFPQEWLRVDPNGRQIQIVPSGGSLAMALLGQGGTYLPIIYRNLQYLPQLFHVYYTVGWPEGGIPRRLIDAACKKACIDILAIVGDIIYGPGVVSRTVSIDGISQSESYANSGQEAAVFTGRISRYLKDLNGDPSRPEGSPEHDGLILSIKKHYIGLNLTAL